MYLIFREPALPPLSALEEVAWWGFFLSFWRKKLFEISINFKNLKLQVSGPCASGFGACCVLYTSTCGGTIPHNTTYIRHNINLQYHLHQAQYLTIPTIPYIKIFTKNGRLRGNFTRNPEYPSTYNAESSCTWTVPKIQSDVCHIRWDCAKISATGLFIATRWRWSGWILMRSPLQTPP